MLRAKETEDGTMSTATEHSTSGQVVSRFNHWWTTRPVRPLGERKIAGVSAAIGYRYDIDPTLIRIAFVVATLCGGSGIPMYLLGWILFRHQDEDLRVYDTLFEDRSGRTWALPLFLSIITLVMFPSVPSLAELGSMSFIGFALGALGMYALYNRCTEPPEYMRWAYPQDSTEPADIPAAAPVYTMTNDQRVQWERDGGQAPRATARNASTATDDEAAATSHPRPPAPPSWDPLGTASFAWDLPDPATALAEQQRSEQERADKRRSRQITWSTIGIAVAAAAIASFFVAANLLNASTVLAIALAVLGVGIIVGARYRSGLLLIPVAIVIAFSMMITSLAQHASSGGLTDQFRVTASSTTWAPRTLEELDGGLAVGSSETSIDLNDLTLDKDASTHIHAVASTVRLNPNPAFNVDFTCTKSVASTCEDLFFPATKQDAPTLTISADFVATELIIQ